VIANKKLWEVMSIDAMSSMLGDPVKREENIILAAKRVQDIAT
jgi:hypothetical protein